MKSTLFAFAALASASCSLLDQNIVNGASYPEGASVYRCTQFDGSVSGTWTKTVAQVDGCQCLHLGAELSGPVTVKAGEECSITFYPKSE